MTALTSAELRPPNDGGAAALLSPHGAVDATGGPSTHPARGGCAVFATGARGGSSGWLRGAAACEAAVTGSDVVDSDETRATAEIATAGRTAVGEIVCGGGGSSTI